MANDEPNRVDFVIVDDDQRVGDMLTRYLQTQGRTASSLSDASKLLPWLELYRCSAVILDIDMPGIDGLSLLRQVRQRHPELPVIMFTGAGYDEQKLQTALRAGANGYVSKGLSASETYAAISRAIGQSGNR